MYVLSVRFTPVLVVPLSPPGGTAKPLALRVDWTVLVAPAPGGSCAPDAAATAKLQQGAHQRAAWTPAE